jgi:hypothetical protein
MVDVGFIFLNCRRQQSEWPALRLRDRPVAAENRRACLRAGTCRGIRSRRPGPRFNSWISLAIITVMVIIVIAGSSPRLGS